jgi:adenylate cyclase 10
VGIATGPVFAGVVGTSGSRREYSVLGDSVNLSARLMQVSIGEKVNKIICCKDTVHDSQHKIYFEFFKMVQLKGKHLETPLYVPYSDMGDIMNLRE